jgi:YegS/Rv2252/BmrU family lipid kinase
MKHFFAIVNPAAGSGRCGKLAPEAIARVRAAGIDIETVETSGPHDATRLSREAYERGERHFVAIGGDGTVFEIVNGLFPEALSGSRVSVGFLPLGTGNSFLRDFTKLGEQAATEALIDGKSRPCDVICLEHHQGKLYYINLLSLGFPADVCALTNRYLKGFGYAGYGLGVVATVAGLKARAYPLRMNDGRRWDDPVTFISFCNSRFTGGTMMMAPAAVTDDGLLELVSMGAMGRLDLLSTFPKIFSGDHVHHPKAATARASRIDLDIDTEVDAMIDGEVVRCIPRSLEVLPGALEVRI